MKDYTLDPNDIQCWLIDLDAEVYAVSYYLQMLSVAEKCRANRFAFKELKDRYIISHGILNTLLARYLKTSQFEFTLGEFGKPFIKNSSIHFNLSHSNSYAAIAFANFKIGIDIEFMKEDAIIESIFSKNEREYFDKIQESLKLETFYQVWVRKEAYLKALGTGLSQPIHEVEVGFNTPSDWSLIPFALTNQYCGCIASQNLASKVTWHAHKHDFLKTIPSTPSHLN